MASEQDRRAAARSILGAFSAGVPFVKFGREEDPVVLAYRRKGEEIDDPECGEVYQALEGGVFQRFTKHSAGAESFVWMRLGPADPEFIEQALDRVFEDMGADEVRGISFDLVFQKMRFEDRKERDCPPQPTPFG